MSMKRIYRKIWVCYLTGVLLFFAILAFGGKLEGKNSLNIFSKYALLLFLPAACIIYGVYVSIRYWRCEYCGASLPTEMAKKCNKCKREIYYS